MLTHTIGDTTIRYPQDAKTGRIGLELIPTALLGKTVARRTTLRGLPFIDAMPGSDPWPAAVVQPLVQFKLAGDPYPGAFAQGRTMRGSPGMDAFKFSGQRVEKNPARKISAIVTTLARADGCRVEHRMEAATAKGIFTSTSTFTNASPAPVTLEMLSSFSLGGITPFAPDDATGRLRAHRFRSCWSAEGRLETRTLEELHLERSWSGAGAFSERFGQVGTMPVRGWFPFVALEDTEAGVVWGAQLAWAGSWQMEIFRQHDDACISGGLVDREFGHWTKTLAPGESLTTPPATLACVQGGLDELCDRLTAAQVAAVETQPAVEQDLPIVFNDWCTFWGDPRHDDVVDIARRLAGTPVRYQVIDAGWYKRDDSDWGSGHGDWEPSARLFPGGLAATAAAIREHGLIPGLWYEMETVGSGSRAFRLAEHLLKLDGRPIDVRERRMWDLNDPFAIDYLAKRVIGLLRDCGFGYLKVDYNETLGIGCDCTDNDSHGEGLRRQVEGTYRFFEKIRRELPELVIENCSSGGHRLEPSMLGRTAMSSFSDAHELVEIPIIAANLHRLMLPRQSQIWAVLHRADSERRLIYSLAATFLGRMCLSGEIAALTDAQWQTVLRAMALYRAAAPVIKHGVSRRFGDMAAGASWRHPRGWQAVTRVADDGNNALVVAHTFADAPAVIDVPLPLPQPRGRGRGKTKTKWNIAGTLASTAVSSASHPRIREGVLRLAPRGDFDGQVVLLYRGSRQSSNT